MKLKPNPRYREFRQTLKKMMEWKHSWNGMTFRSVKLPYARRNVILDGKGSFTTGGRWNPPGTFLTIYSSQGPDTAANEAFSIARHFGLDENELRPRVTVALWWRLAGVIDITDPLLPGWIDVTTWLKEDFRAINRQGFETLAQAFGRASYQAGLTGFFCPSSTSENGRNLVVFKNRLVGLSSVRILGANQLDDFIK